MGSDAEDEDGELMALLRVMIIFHSHVRLEYLFFFCSPHNF